MSRLADPTATAPVDLGACQCPGTPHEADGAVVRWQLSGSALARVGTAETMGRLTGDPFAGYRQLVSEALVSWTLLHEVTEDDAKVIEPVATTTRYIEQLDTETLTTLAEQIDALAQSKGTLPNASGAPSVASPQESASPTPKPTPTPGT